MSKLNAPRNHPQQVKKRGTGTPLFDNGQSATDEVDTRVTDDKLWRELDAMFHFTIDVAASSENAKCERFYDIAANGLFQRWDGETVWCNPPYSDLAAWVQKASSETAATVVMLLPANRTEQPWWQTYIEPFRDGKHTNIRPISTWFLAGRRAFHDPKLKSAVHMPFGAVVVVFRGQPLSSPVKEGL